MIQLIVTRDGGRGQVEAIGVTSAAGNTSDPGQAPGIRDKLDRKRVSRAACCALEPSPRRTASFRSRPDAPPVEDADSLDRRRGVAASETVTASKRAAMPRRSARARAHGQELGASPAAERVGHLMRRGTTVEPVKTPRVPRRRSSAPAREYVQARRSAVGRPQSHERTRMERAWREQPTDGVGLRQLAKRTASSRALCRSSTNARC